jgi:hypothetical protein
VSKCNLGLPCDDPRHKVLNALLTEYFDMANRSSKEGFRLYKAIEMEKKRLKKAYGVEPVTLISPKACADARSRIEARLKQGFRVFFSHFAYGIQQCNQASPAGNNCTRKRHSGRMDCPVHVAIDWEGEIRDIWESMK